MPDISMCQNVDCPFHESCYRFNATPSDYQSYADFAPVDGACEYYEKMEKK